MQLFISDDYTINQNNITIYDERIVHQCFRVLRYKSNQSLQLQNKGIRYTLCIINISKKEIIAEITDTEKSLSHDITTTLFIALPNRRDKAELIVQKCTEIGIDHIGFWKAERSTLRDLPDKKLQRLDTIALEASEQSFRRSLPGITYLDNLWESDILSSGQIILFHQDGKYISEIQQVKTQHSTIITSIIGPEGGFSPKELEFLEKKQVLNWSLGDTILRMETAAIIGSRMIKNLQNKDNNY